MDEFTSVTVPCLQFGSYHWQIGEKNLQILGTSDFINRFYFKSEYFPVFSNGGTNRRPTEKHEDSHFLYKD